jgi:hypothetical protein
MINEYDIKDWVQQPKAVPLKDIQPASFVKDQATGIPKFFMGIFNGFGSIMQGYDIYKVSTEAYFYPYLHKDFLEKPYGSETSK